MLSLRGITVDCAAPDELGAFWASALGYDQRTALWEPYTGAKDPAGHGPHLTFQRTTGNGTNHLHLDLYSDDPDADVARLETMGATRVRRVDEGDTWWWVVRDPAGNEFCIIAAQGPDRAL